LSKNEIRTRIIHILRHFPKIDLRKLDWEAHLEDGLGLDSLERIAIITSIEENFRTVFEDNLFDHLNSLEQIVDSIAMDTYAF
jgi:NADH dehydrogenase (ubiquinone) 1 alpha/beta subcomplex 1